jgi:hypothetical protein
MATSQNNPGLLPASSRYYSVGVASFSAPDGKQIVYFRRRFAPTADSLQPMGSYTVAQGDRPDLVATKTLGDASQYWRICDANNAMEPAALLAHPGDALSIPRPAFQMPNS